MDQGGKAAWYLMYVYAPKLPRTGQSAHYAVKLSVIAYVSTVVSLPESSNVVSKALARTDDNHSLLQDT